MLGLVSGRLVGVNDETGVVYLNIKANDKLKEFTNIYHCSNPDCGETWDVNDKGYLIPGYYFENGKLEEGWINDSEKHTDCPSCSDNWEWSK